MKLSSLLPTKFSSRLFLITLIAGLIPIIIFAVLIEIYGREFQPKIRNRIQQAYDEEWSHSKAILNKTIGTLIEQKALDVAMQLDLILQSHPYMTLQDLQRDKVFREIAVQQVGREGYTALHDSDTGVTRFHKDARVKNKDPGVLKRDFPTLWSIIEKSLSGNTAYGYYDWTEAGGEIRQKYLYITPLRQRTADNVRLSVAVTATVDEFTQPVRDAEVIYRNTSDRLSTTIENLLRSFKKMAFLFMGIGILIISFVAYSIGMYFSRAITSLREATRKVNEGDFDALVKPPMSGEVKTLAEDFNRMVRQLAATTVSKELLQESEKQLIDANFNLQHEIAVRMLVEKALATEKEQLSITLRSIGDGVITADTTGKIVLINQSAENMTGWSEKEAIGAPLINIFHNLDEKTRVQSEDPLQEIIEKNETENLERTDILINRYGVERIIMLSGAPIRDKDNIILGVVIVFRDITEKRKMEEELLTIRKLESVGTLAGGIAHDFNNILAVILGNISFAKTFIDPENKVYERLTDAEDATLRGKDLTYRLLTFSRGGEPLKKVVSLKKVIKDAARLTLSGSNVKCTYKIPDDLSRAEIDEGQIRQVIHNIVMNAKEAMPDGGKITIRAANITLTPDDAIPLSEGDYVKISIEDRGGGIPEEDLSRIFDPYFTKKEMGNTKGMGLGLAICYSIIKNHDGFMVAESHAEEGMTLHIYLPAYREAVYNEQTEQGQAAGAGKHKILYMDDEVALLDIVGQMLDYLGFDAAFATDGAEAVTLYSEAWASGKPFNLVIMDLTIPGGMGGKETVQKIREIDPKAKAIVSSGYAEDPIMHNFKEYGFSGAIAKPYDVQALGEIIKRVMEGRDI
ncbi:MAG: hypothetical protein C0399_03380 [Syntrophus sp. (in: bacteria)]|nr:hypothetical protein [Syntrophus sp. (in: bacteria)]